MTDGQVVLFLMGLAAVYWLFKKKKPPEVVFFDVVEIWEQPKKRTPPWMVNVVFVAGVVLFIWIMNR